MPFIVLVCVLCPLHTKYFCSSQGEMGSTSSVDKKAGIKELVENEVLTVSGGSGNTAAPGPSPKSNESSGAQPGQNPSENASGAHATTADVCATAAKPIVIRRKNKGHTRQGSNGSGSGAPSAPPTPLKRSIKLYEGSGPITQWKKGNLVGKGATGAVYEAEDLATNGIFCVKEIQFTDDFADNPHDMQRFEALRREIALLKDIHHANVVHFLGVDRVNFIIYIQMEYVYGGNIHDIVRNFGALGEDTAGKFTLQILEGLDYLHDKNIVHRDVKGANILVGVNGEVKLADFGAAKRALDSEELFKTLAGTPYWMAPEVVRQEGHNKAADVWSLGATVLQMLTGSAPYQGLAPVPALFKIGHSTDSPVPAEIPGVSAEVVEFIRWCLTRDTTKRPSVKQLLEHAWMRKHSDIREEKKRSRTRRLMLVEQSLAAALPVPVTSPEVTRSAPQQEHHSVTLVVDSPPPPARHGPPVSSAVSACSDAEMLRRNSEWVEDANADEELQIKEFVAYVSQRHQSLQREQQAKHCAEAIVDVPKPAKRYDSPPSSLGSVDSLGNPIEAPPVQHTSNNYISASHRLEEDDDDDRLPPVGAAVPTSPSAAPAPPLTGGRAPGALGHATMTIIEDPGEEDDGGDDVAFDVDFDEAHFDEIIAGLGDVRMS